MNAGQGLNIKENIERVKERIYWTAKNVGRNPGDISLIAVTKQKSAAVIKSLAENGIRQIGESYLQEAVFKIDLLANLDIEWHMIGNIQRGKEKQIANRFNVVHSVGTTNTAQELNRYGAANNKILPVYLEINVSGEITKHGWQVQDLNNLEMLQPDIEEIVDLPHLHVLGLMTMAPYSADPEGARPYFKRLSQIRDNLVKRMPGTSITGLSMGMSGDFEVAIEEGATAIRIGSALVGTR